MRQGVYRRSRPRLELGVGVPMGLAGHGAPVGVVAKLNWEFERNGESD
jgi:hypothetical protein